MGNQTKPVRDVRVVKKTLYDNHSQKKGEWYEVQYSTWVPYRTYGGAIKFNHKKEALDFALRKKAGATSNGTETEVVT